MAYRQVEADDHDEGTALEFKTFTPNETSNANGSGRAAGRQGSSYYQEGGQAGFWTVEYYQKYFDVDTKTIITRCYTTLLPTSTNYLTSHTTPSVDLYGPFWTLTTLIFSLFVFSSFTASLVNYLSPKTDEPYSFDFTLLSVAVTLVYSYGLGLPALVWIALRYMGVVGGSSGEDWSLVECVASWGYGMFVWIPVSLLCIIPVPILRWVLVGAAFGLSGFFIFSNIWPILAGTDQKSSRLILAVLIPIHAGIALTFKVLFFSYYITNEIGPKDPIPGGNEGTENMKRWLMSVMS